MSKEKKSPRLANATRGEVRKALLTIEADERNCADALLKQAADDAHECRDDIGRLRVDLVKVLRLPRPDTAIAPLWVWPTLLFVFVSGWVLGFAYGVGSI